MGMDRAFDGEWLLIFEHDPLFSGYVRKEMKYFLDEARAWQRTTIRI
jgi:hypothetical protein